jgi:hypothetical protein
VAGSGWFGASHPSRDHPRLCTCASLVLGESRLPLIIPFGGGDLGEGRRFAGVRMDIVCPDRFNGITANMTQASCVILQTSCPTSQT